MVEQLEQGGRGGLLRLIQGIGPRRGVGRGGGIALQRAGATAILDAQTQVVGRFAKGLADGVITAHADNVVAIAVPHVDGGVADDELAGLGAELEMVDESFANLGEGGVTGLRGCAQKGEIVGLVGVFHAHVDGVHAGVREVCSACSACSACSSAKELGGCREQGAWLTAIKLSDRSRIGVSVST